VSHHEQSKCDGGRDRGDGQEFSAGMVPDRFVGRHIFGALDSFRSELERPGQDQGHRKAEKEKEDHDPRRPVGNVEEGKNLGRDLDQDPAHDGVSNRDAVNVPPLQFPQEPAPIHPATVVNRWGRVSEPDDSGGLPSRAGLQSIPWSDTLAL